MKKVMLMVFLTAFLPSIDCELKCKAISINDDIKGLPPHYPNVTTIHNSHYDNSTNLLYIYGSDDSEPVVEVIVKYRGTVVLSDIITPDDLPATYDFSSRDKGTYEVFISANATLLYSFSFNKY